jgi:hypothetical protein
MQKVARSGQVWGCLLLTLLLSFTLPLKRSHWAGLEMFTTNFTTAFHFAADLTTEFRESDQKFRKEGERENKCVGKKKCLEISVKIQAHWLDKAKEMRRQWVLRRYTGSNAAVKQQ